jgi:hypothetical protein
VRAHCRSLPPCLPTLLVLTPASPPAMRSPMHFATLPAADSAACCVPLPRPGLVLGPLMALRAVVGVVARPIVLGAAVGFGLRRLDALRGGGPSRSSLPILKPTPRAVSPSCPFVNACAPCAAPPRLHPRAPALHPARLLCPCGILRRGQPGPQAGIGRQRQGHGGAAGHHRGHAAPQPALRARLQQVPAQPNPGLHAPPPRIRLRLPLPGLLTSMRVSNSSQLNSSQLVSTHLN